MKSKLNITSEESFANLREIENKKWDGRCDYTDWQKQKKMERDVAIKKLVPTVGLGCTICYYSDRRAATVTKVVSQSMVEVMFNRTKCLDYFAGEYEILSELEGEPKVFTKRRNGMWVAEGQRSKDGVLLMLHYQNHYIDPTF